VTIMLAQQKCLRSPHTITPAVWRPFEGPDTGALQHPQADNRSVVVRLPNVDATETNCIYGSPTNPAWQARAQQRRPEPKVAKTTTFLPWATCP